MRPPCPSCSVGADDALHLLFECCKAAEVWHRLGLGDFIKKACTTDRAGEAVLDFLMQTSVQEFGLIGQNNIHEIIAICIFGGKGGRLSMASKHKTLHRLCLPLKL